MGRQTAKDWTLDGGAGVARSLDPASLPVHFESRMGPDCPVTGQAMACEVELSQQEVTIRLAEGTGNGAVVAPVASYAGVMVQITPDEEPGCVTARLILKHFDPALSIILIETDQPEGLAQSWPAWSRALNLPMLVCDTAGTVKPIEAYSASPLATPSPRRKLPLLTGRRPRFLVRRRCGAQNSQPVHRGEAELIARH